MVVPIAINCTFHDNWKLGIMLVRDKFTRYFIHKLLQANIRSERGTFSIVNQKTPVLSNAY